ncbi:Clp protease N-terminal domain-containing protein [Phytomonospora endophytica]|uniref:Clp R domain-containing protein n=1 Tax=Phytomonospora endophytica TaxID=714109 RepID=A0A841FZ36_9ACTN|nr:Clp protease N-terminal domain-containing protein [Phytomonospora endophytica]MBB6038978.1 hypothetical protein [Phytomonospora endophytica]GIG67918.1 hypothetical protein Pen01_42130 [Phytomonospora endophytica]
MERYPVRLGDLIEFVNQQPGGPLDHLSAASEIGAYLDEISDHLIGHFVDQARRAGSSWSEIGQYIGVSKQAAQKRFVAKASDLPTQLSGAFARFTARARHVTVQSSAEARAMGHQEVGGEHILLALLVEPDALAARALAEQGADEAKIRASVAAAHPATDEETPEHIPFSAEAKKILDLTLREALRYGHNYIGTEHMLLGILRDGKGIGAKVLDELGVRRKVAEAWIGGELAKLTAGGDVGEAE